jgi:Family of unknown function (DUF6069)
MPPYSLRRLLWGGIIATFAAILADLLFYIVTKALGEHYILPLDGNNSHLGQLPISTIVVTILIPGLLATTFFGLLIRFARRPATVFLSVSVAALLLSFGGPWYLPAAAMQTKILLGGMHAIAAVVISGGILVTSHQAS